MLKLISDAMGSAFAIEQERYLDNCNEYYFNSTDGKYKLEASEYHMEGDFLMELRRINDNALVFYGCTELPSVIPNILKCIKEVMECNE